VAKERAGILVDEQFFSAILRDATIRMETRLSTNDSGSYIG